jgi:hypothetical protein
MLALWLDQRSRGVIYLTIARGDILSPLVNVKTIDGAVIPLSCHAEAAETKIIDNASSCLLGLDRKTPIAFMI